MTRTWQAFALVRFINSNRIVTQDALAGKRVLELGSGTGVVGMACAALGTRARGLYF